MSCQLGAKKILKVTNLKKKKEKNQVIIAWVRQDKAPWTPHFPLGAGGCPVSAWLCVAGPANPNAALVSGPSVISLFWAITTKIKKSKRWVNISTSVKFSNKARKPELQLQCISERQLPYGETLHLRFTGSCQVVLVLCQGCSCLCRHGTRHLRQAQEPGSFVYHNFTLVWLDLHLKLLLPTRRKIWNSERG